MDDAERHFETNRSLWNGWTRINERSAFYDVAGFRAGASTLKAIERAEVGDVAGKTLLHLQCHFGLDTMSWARLGARVVGVDFSDEAVALARALATDLSIPADFVQANVYDLPGALPPTVPRRYDIVFTSYGVLAWLPDLRWWADAIVSCLAPGGIFYMVEFHPVVFALSDDGRVLEYSYFGDGIPIQLDAQGSYADRNAPFAHRSVQWAHSLGEVVSALIDAGLRLELLRELPFSSYGVLAYAEQRSPDEWRVREGPDLPLMFSVRCRL